MNKIEKDTVYVVCYRSTINYLYGVLVALRQLPSTSQEVKKFAISAIEALKGEVENIKKQK